MAEDSGRISVSKDFLRAELGQLKLDLIEELATKAEVEILRREVSDLKDEVDILKTWKATLTGLATGAFGLAGLATTIALHPWH